MDAWAETLKGKFLVLDGPDGAGKTTQLDRLERRLAGLGLAVTRAVDPGGTAVGREIREILLHGKDLHIDRLCETFLFMASRAQLISEVIRPALQAGRVVLCDRFISSTIAYQGASGVDPQQILDLGGQAVEGLWPDLTIVLDVPVATGLGRVGPKRDRMESREEDYHEQVRAQFRTLGRSVAYPAPVVHLDAAGTPEDVHARVWAALQERFEDA